MDGTHIRTLAGVVFVGVMWLSAGVVAVSADNEETSAAINVAGLLLELPEAWQQETPSSPMRKIQAGVPGEAGDGELVVFFFGEGGGGGVEANIQRWIDQIEIAPNTLPQRDVIETNGLQITWVDVSGTLKPSMMGIGPTTPIPNSRLLGAVVEGSGGPWFLKVVGPDATLGDHLDGFVQMLKNLQPA